MALSAETEVTGGVSGGPTYVVPTGAALGATVKGVDLKDLEEVAFARIIAFNGREDSRRLARLRINSSKNQQRRRVG
jgi:hypothetical protein